MSEKYINVFAAIQAKPEFLNENNENKEKALYAKGWNACNKEYIDNLLDIPAEDVCPVKEGKWIEVGNNQPLSCDTLYGCSRCQTGRRLKSELTNYCPNCGADMARRVQTNE